MKLAIVTFHNDMSEQQICGLATAPVYLSELLEKYAGVDTDLIAVGKQNRYSGFIDRFKFVHHDNVAEVLNTYDGVIFITPGKPWEKFNEKYKGHKYDYIFDKLNVDFAFVINEETDRPHYPYADEFYSNTHCKAVIFNSEDMHYNFEDFIPKNGKYIEFNFMIPLNDKEEILEKARHKEDIVISTARWSPRKRVFELVELSDELFDRGIRVQVAGAKQTYFAVKKILDLDKKNWEDLGYYTPDKLPELLEKPKYHYNFVFLKRKLRNRVMRPRVELSTFEALNEGCLPIVCNDLMPSWLRSTSGLQLSSKELETLPDVLESMTDELRLRMISDFYDDIVENVIPMYEDIANLFKEEL